MSRTVVLGSSSDVMFAVISVRVRSGGVLVGARRVRVMDGSFVTEVVLGDLIDVGVVPVVVDVLVVPGGVVLVEVVLSDLLVVVLGVADVLVVSVGVVLDDFAGLIVPRILDVLVIPEVVVVPICVTAPLDNVSVTEPTYSVVEADPGGLITRTLLWSVPVGGTATVTGTGQSVTSRVIVILARQGAAGFGSLPGRQAISVPGVSRGTGGSRYVVGDDPW